MVFSVAVIGNPPLYYQWKEDGTNLTDGAGISGSTTRVLTLPTSPRPVPAVYSVMVSNAAGSVLSGDAVLGVITSPPQITVQPASQSLLVGGTAVFSVTAVGDLPLSYQWLENGTNLTDGGQISGSATSALTISNLVESNDGTYSVIINNAIAIAPIASSDAMLSVFAVSASGTTVTSLALFHGRQRWRRPQRPGPGNQRPFVRHDAKRRPVRRWHDLQPVHQRPVHNARLI